MPDYISSANKLSLTSQTTTNSYVDFGSAMDVLPFKSINIEINNTGVSNSVTYKILGSLNGGTTYSVTITPDTVIAASSSDYKLINKHFSHIKIQIKATSSSNQTTVTANILMNKN